MAEPEQKDTEPSQSRRGLSAWQIAKSTAAAALGVQTPEARQRDFTEGNPIPFIIAGVVGTAVFVVVLVIIVNLVLAVGG